MILLVNHTVIQFGQFCLVPTVGCTDKISGDTLQFVDIRRITLRTFVKAVLCILIAAVHTTVAVVVYRAIADIVLIHECYNIIDSLRIVCCVTIYFHIEYVTATGKFMIWGFNLRFLSRGTMIIDRNMV